MQHKSYNMKPTILTLNELVILSIEVTITALRLRPT